MTRLWVLWKTGRLLAAFAVIGVVAYSIAVLVSVAVTGDIGIRCVIDTEIREVLPYEWSAERLAVAPAYRATADRRATFSADPPVPGDRLLAIGPWTVRYDNYHDYVQALRELRGAVDQRVEVVWETDSGARRIGQVTVRRPPGPTYLWSCVWFAQEMVVFSIGALVFWKRPRDESARLFFWLCVVTVGAFMGGYHWTLIVINPPLIHLFAAFAVFVPILSLHFYLVFPRTNPFFDRHRRLVLTVLYGLPVLWLTTMLAAMIWAATASTHVLIALGVVRALALWYVRLSAAIFVVCLLCLTRSFFRARGRLERNQVQWILLATFLSFLPIGYLLRETWHEPTRLGLTSSAWPMFIVSLLYTVAYATSITRYKLMQAEALLNRGMVYFVVSVAAGLLYSGGLIIAALVIGDQFQGVRTSTGVILAGLTALVVLVFSEAVRHQVQKALDRRFHRDKVKLDQAMKRMSLAVGSLVDRGTLGHRLLEAATEVLRLDWGAIYLRDLDGGPPSLVACLGPEPDDRTVPEDSPLLARLRDSTTFRVPHSLAPPLGPAAADALIALGGEVAVALHVDDALAGFMVLGPKRNGLPYENEEISFLSAISSIAALALRSADIQATLEGLNLELRDKVEKIAEQRRRILVLQNQLAGRGREPDTDGSPEDAPSDRAAVTPNHPGAFDAIKGSGKAVQRMVDLARRVAASPSAVLIRGESGTGKELVAEAIHRAGPRAARPFVKVHCAALSQGLLESELFGHVKGAFTSADRDRVGRFQQADGGTLFLDEIGDINWDVQTKLLRVLERMEFERVGSSQTIAVDVRIIAATNQDLEALIRNGRFREDLFYRLNVIPLRTPALRERREDIFELAVHFLNVHARRAGKTVTSLDETTVEALMAYDWPGNVRELENVIEGAVVLANGPAILLDDLPVDVRRPSRRKRKPTLALATFSARPVPSAEAPTKRPFPRPHDAPHAHGPVSANLDDDPDPEFLAYEKQRLLDALAEANHNKASAARLLAMPRSTFFSKLRKHGLA